MFYELREGNTCIILFTSEENELGDLLNGETGATKLNNEIKQRYGL
jgi:hypothetical protein